MEVTNTLLTWVAQVLNFVLPVLNLPPEFLNKIDAAVCMSVDFINSAGYFIPLDTLGACFGVVILVDNWSILFKMGSWIVKLIRG